MLHEDKRRFMRMNINADARVTVLETGFKLAAKCQDLSATGMSLVVTEPMDVEAMVEIHIPSSGANVAPLVAHAKVLRVRQEQDGEYIVGVEITQFN